MSSKPTDDDDAQKRTVTENETIGSRHVSLAGVGGAGISVRTPELFEDETIAVSAYAYDDEGGQVTLRFGSEVAVGVTLDASDARELAEQIDAAADEAEADL